MLTGQQRRERGLGFFVRTYRRGAGTWHRLARRAHSNPCLQPDHAQGRLSWERGTEGSARHVKWSRRWPRFGIWLRIGIGIRVRLWLWQRWGLDSKWAVCQNKRVERLLPRTRYVLFLLVTCGLSCAPRDNPQVKYDHAYKTLLHGDLKQAEEEAREQGRRHRASDEWTWKFRILEARALLQQGHYDEGVKLLNSAPFPSNAEFAIPVLTLEGEVDEETHEFTAANNLLSRALDLCAASVLPSCGYVLKAKGHLAGQRSQWQEAERFYKSALEFAREHSDVPLEAQALVSIGNIYLAQGRYDEAIEWSENGFRAASSADARRLKLIARGNTGWAYYKLGDPEKALELLSESENLASKLGDSWTQGNQLNNIGQVYLDEGRFDKASESFHGALSLANATKAKAFIYNALRVLARLSLQTGDPTAADQYAQQALDIARQDNNHLDELYPTLVEGQIAARRGENDKAEATFLQVERDTACPVFLKWEAEHSLARLYEAENHADRADRQYRAALATFEAARDTVKHEDSQLSFLTNASRIYDDYVHFLVAQKKPDEALRWADYSRAQTLAQGLGLLNKASLKKAAFAGPAPSNPRQTSRRAGGAIFFYWLGEAQSYLWAIGPREVNLFPLPPRAQIESAVARYRKSLGGPQSVLGASAQSADPDALWLYRTLVAPAKQFVGKDAKVFIIPDGSLNNLNFETLVVDEPSPHFWIEDADVVNASSLRVLEASLARGSVRSESARNKPHAGNILLIGDSVAPGADYPELPRAADQMKTVAKHFSDSNERIFSREQATPQAYLATTPGQFSYIHFVAHGTASRLSPLDSAIVLSRNPSQPDSFKLYARDIVGHPLRADLVTISACYSAGERAYSGEGLVGLAWAFLRAGAHNVIAGLWEVTDVSTDQLMERFYGEIEKGAAVDKALRDAKLSLLHGNSYRNPYYWAPFQLYTGS